MYHQYHNTPYLQIAAIDKYPPNCLERQPYPLLCRLTLRTQIVLEECARANPDARIRPLTYASVDRAYQAESVGSNSLVSILISIRHSPNL
jgi:hypothetical protein